MRHPFLNPLEYSRHSKLQYDFAHTMLRACEIKPTDRILDIGCGDGKITADIAEIVKNGQVIGTDISQQMIHFATRAHTPRYGNLGFMVMNAELNVFRKQFDVVTSFCCLHWVRKQSDALKGIQLALVENGKALLLVPLRHQELYSAIEAVVDSKPWSPFFAGFTNPHMFFSRAQYKKLLLDSGMSPQTLDETTMQYTLRTKLEFEMFLKAWLPHIKMIPESLQNKFMDDIGNKYIESNPDFASDAGIGLPLRMLKVQAIKLAPCLSARQGLFSDKEHTLIEKNTNQSNNSPTTLVRLTSKL